MPNRPDQHVFAKAEQTYQAHEHGETMVLMLEKFRSDHQIPRPLFIEILAAVAQEFRLQWIAGNGPHPA